jgi:RHS repeat-associated protein
LISANHLIAAHYLYDPYGNILSQSGSLADANLYRFSSKEFHATSGLVYYLYRFYEPTLQRWINRDPLQELGGINLYSYVGNAPTDMIDEFGLGGPSWDWWYRWLLLIWSLGHPYDPPRNPPNPPKGPPPIVQPVAPSCPNNTNTPPVLPPIIYIPGPFGNPVNSPPWRPSPFLPKPPPVLIYPTTITIIIIIFWPKPIPV